MPIQFACPHCKKKLSVKDELAGKRGACPACKKVIAVPAVSTSTPPPASKPLSAEFEALAASALADEKKEEVKEPTTVDFLCPQCDAELHLAAELAGKQAPCPECRRIIKVPLLENVGPRDWRQPEKQVGPSGALKKDAALEGAWGTATSRGSVSRAALVEADVIKEPKRKLTPRDWTIRVSAGVLGLTVLVFGGYFGLDFFKSNLEQQGIARAEDLLNNPEEKMAGVPAPLRPAMAAEAHRLLGEYYLHTGKPDPQQRTGQQRLQLARQLASSLADPAEKQALLRELLIQQMELDVDAAELSTTLSLVAPEIFRLDMVRTLARQAAATGSLEKPGKLKMAILSAVPARQTGGGELDYSQQISGLGVLGQELARAGQMEAAVQLAEEARLLYRPEHPYPRPLGVLMYVVKRPELESKDQEQVMAARMEAAARLGDLATARQILDQQLKNPTWTRLDGILSYLEVAVEKGQKEDVAACVPEFMKIAEPYPDDSVWQRQKMAELLIAAGQAEEAGRFITAFLNGQAQNRARLAAFLAGTRDFDSLPQDLSPQSPAYAVALALIGRSKAKSDRSGAVAWAGALPGDVAQAFAGLGASLGMMDNK